MDAGQPDDRYDYDQWYYLVGSDELWEPESNLIRLSVLEQLAWVAQ